MRDERSYGACARLFAVLVLHVLVIAAIAQANPEMRRAVLPIMVSLITPFELLPQTPPPKPRPRPVVQQQPTPVVPLPRPAPAVVESLPRAISIPAPSPVPDPVPATPAPVIPAAAAPAAVVPAPPAPAPLPVVAPRFDAAYLNNPAPTYPALARRLGERGRVLLRVHVNPDGKTREVQVRISSGSARLDQAARDAVERWRFVPARQGDEAVGAWVLVPISFQLEG